MIKIHTYDEVYLLSVRYLGNGQCQIQGSPVIYHKRDVINKMACYISDGEDYEDLVSDLYEMTSDKSVPPGSRLYVASECATSRDTFRNSGYSISKSESNANAIVVPDVSASKYACRSCNFVATGKGDMGEDAIFLVNVEKSGYYGVAKGEEEVNFARKFVESTLQLVPDTAFRSYVKVWFIPKCEELRSVMEERTFNVPYIQESLVPINPSTRFSAETLLFWENIDDVNLLVRTICTSDWMKYPTTLWCFLCMYGAKNSILNWYTKANGDFRRILQNIEYSAYNSIKDELLGRDLSPDDYDMLQSYVYLKMGVDENGGMVDPKTWKKIPVEMRRILQRRVIVKPFHLPTKMNAGNIEELLR